MKDMTKHSYSAVALAVVGLFAFAACSMQPGQANLGGSTPAGSQSEHAGAVPQQTTNLLIHRSSFGFIQYSHFWTLPFASSIAPWRRYAQHI